MNQLAKKQMQASLMAINNRQRKRKQKRNFMQFLYHYRVAQEIFEIIHPEQYFPAKYTQKSCFYFCSHSDI